MKISTEKFNTITSILLLLIIVVFCSLFLFISLKKIYLSENENKEITILNRAEDLLFEQYTQNKKILTASQRFIKFILENPENIFIDSSNIIKIKAKKTNQSFNKTFELPSVKIKNYLIRTPNLFVNKQLYINNVFCKIWQKSGDNFVRIASSKPNEKNKYIYINSSEEPAKTIIAGSNYTENVQSDNDLKFISSFPIYYNGKIIFFISIENNKNILSSIGMLFKPDDILIINKKGQIILRKKNNSSLPNKLNLKKGIIQKTENLQTKTLNDKVLYFRYIPELSVYIGYMKNNINSNTVINKLKQNIIFITLILILFLILFFIFIRYKNKQKQSKLLSEFNHLLPLEENRPNSLEKFITSFGQYFSEINKITDDIANEKYESKINEKFKKDKLYSNLTGIKNTFLEIKQQETTKKEELKFKENFDKSAIQISEILQYASELEDLSYKVIKHISEFIGAEQIALFIVYEDLKKNKTLKMTASYAYSKQRTAQKEFKINEGLIGRAYLEKKSVFLTEIPDNYTFIESGFGFQKPGCLLIVPLIFNNDVQALIELGSINIISEKQIKFLEDTGENIASTIANLKHSKQTEFLLKQTTEQSKEIEEQRKTLEEKINTHRKQNRNLDKQILQLIEIIDSIKSVSFLIEYDLKGNIIDVSSKVINLFGANKEDFISKSHKQIIKSENYSEYYKNFRDDLAANKIQYLEETLKAGNKEILMKQTYVPIRNARRKIYRILSIGTIKE